MSTTVFNYNKRNFFELRDEIKTYIKSNYPDVFVNLEDNSVGSVFIDILAGTAEANYFNLDRTFQETQLENAQLAKSMFNIAKNLGIKLPNKKPSITLVDLEVTVPAQNDTYSRDYLPIIGTGTQFTNGNVVFELLNDVDFSLLAIICFYFRMVNLRLLLHRQTTHQTYLLCLKV